MRSSYAVTTQRLHNDGAANEHRLSIDFAEITQRLHNSDAAIMQQFRSECAATTQ
jgi:hypothetical protein